MAASESDEGRCKDPSEACEKANNSGTQKVEVATKQLFFAIGNHYLNMNVPGLSPLLPGNCVLIPNVLQYRHQGVGW